MLFWLINLILLLIIFILFIILSWVWPPDSPWAPWWKTNKKVARAVCKLSGVTSNDVIYELGSGDGTFLVTAAKEFGVKGVGIEIDPLRYYISIIRIGLSGLTSKIKIIRGNFFDVNISASTVIFVYLVPKALERLKPKLLKELRKGTNIVSLKYEMNLPLVGKDKQNKLYLYKI